VVSGHLENLWLYILAPVLGAATAVPLWKFLKPQQQNENSTL
jgi:glycerol uptake facilitator-like aquaporin